MVIQFNDKKWNLPKIPQYENYLYEPMLCCPNCSGKTTYNWIKDNKYDVVGFCEVNGELMLCCECHICGEKYRYHAYKRFNADFSFDCDFFFKKVALLFYLEQETYSKFEIK